MNYATFSRALFTLGTPHLSWDQDVAGAASQLPLRVARASVSRTNKRTALSESTMPKAESPCSYS